MIKHYCDRCGNEIESSRTAKKYAITFHSPSIFMIRDYDDTAYILCGDCYSCLRECYNKVKASEENA